MLILTTKTICIFPKYSLLAAAFKGLINPLQHLPASLPPISIMLYTQLALMHAVSFGIVPYSIRDGQRDTVLCLLSNDAR